MNVTSLRIHSGHDVFNHAILAGRVHRLKNKQHRPAVLRVELLLQIVEKSRSVVDDLLAVLLVLHAARVARIAMFQPKFFALCDAIGCSEPRAFLNLFSEFHGAASVVQSSRPEQRSERQTEDAQPAKHADQLQCIKRFFIRLDALQTPSACPELQVPQKKKSPPRKVRSGPSSGLQRSETRVFCSLAG